MGRVALIRQTLEHWSADQENEWHRVAFAASPVVDDDGVIKGLAIVSYVA